MFQTRIIIAYIHKPLYTIIWHDCPECNDLLREMDNLNLKTYYVNNRKNVWLDKQYEHLQKKIDTPLFYKDEELIGNSLFDIYSELYPM